jgi:hypothetical protein
VGGLRHLDGVEDAADEHLGRDLLGLGLVRDGDAVAEDVEGDGADVLGRDVGAAAEERVGAGGAVEVDGGAGLAP